MGGEWLKGYLPHKPMPPAWAALWTLAALVLATAVRLAINPWLGVRVPFILYLPMVLVVAVWCGYGPACVAAVAACVLSLACFMQGGPLHDSNPWSLASFALTSALMILIGGTLARILQQQADTEQRLRAKEDELQTLVIELGHRSKNGLMVVMSIVSQSAKGSDTVEHYERLINERLGAMGKAQDIALARGGGSIPLDELLDTVLTPFGLERIAREGLPRALWLGSDAAGSIALVIHELATNALKYGALKLETGRVELVWNADAAGFGHLIWREIGGPPMASTSRKGFGSRLFQVALRNLGGGVVFEPGAEGVMCSMNFPLERASA